MPAEIHANREYTKKADIFSLGCIFYFALSDQAHPFRTPFNLSNESILTNIKNGKQFVEKVTNCDEDYKKFCAIELIKQMTMLHAEKRPNCDSVLKQVLFWDKYKIFNLIKKCNFDERSIFCDNNYEKIIGHDWKEKVDPKLLEKYSEGNEESTLQGLIRMMAKSVSTISLESFLDQINYLCKF